jgi:hypothetical protein
MACGACFAVAMVTALPAWAADPTKAECIASNEKAQELQRAGHLNAAQELLPACVAASCPAALREDCAQRLSAIEAAIPTIVFQVTDAAGNDLSGVRITMDGKPLVEKLGGSAIAIDPGEHRFAFQAEGRRVVEKALILREHDKSRIEKVVLEGEVKADVQARAPTPAPAEATSEPAASGGKNLSFVFVSGGVGVAGIAAGIVLALAEGSKHSALVGECNGNACPTTAQGDLDSFHTLRTAAIAAYGVGALGLIGAGVLYLAAPTSNGSTARLWIGPGSAGVVGEF